MSGMLTESDWSILLKRTRDRKCIPFLVAGASCENVPLGTQLAREWAREHHYPLEDSSDLTKVAEFLAVTEDPMSPNEQIRNRIKTIPLPEFSAVGEQYGILADLPLPVYLATNHDKFILNTLKSRDKDSKPKTVGTNFFGKQCPRASILVLSLLLQTLSYFISMVMPAFRSHSY